MTNRSLSFSLLYLAACACYTGPAAAFSTTFNNFDAQVIFDTSQSPAQQGPFTPGDCPDCAFDITNNSGQTWTDFHLELRLAPGSFGTFGFIDFAGGGYDGDVYEGPGTDALSDDLHSLDIIGLNIAQGGGPELHRRHRQVRDDR
ncbi:MAG: hypothetical protein IT532_13210 [Burkholderiales bacterium]|nr:hypothetical protein [Burkholderiales bacterium]